MVVIIRLDTPSAWAAHGSAVLFKTPSAGLRSAASMYRACAVWLMLLGLAGPSSADVPVSTVANLAFHSSFWLNLHRWMSDAALR